MLEPVILARLARATLAQRPTSNARVTERGWWFRDNDTWTEPQRNPKYLIWLGLRAVRGMQRRSANAETPNAD